jgi:sec-independent protein translocase protein TatA
MQRDYDAAQPVASAVTTIWRHPFGRSGASILGRMPGHWELIVLGLVLLLLFGAKRVPLIGRQLGRSVRELKDTVRDIDPRDDVRRSMEAPEDEARAAGTDRRDEPPA